MQANIPIKFWGHCVLAAAYLINRLPSSVLKGKTPFNKLHGKEPSIAHLRVLGCLCFARMPNQHDKLKSRSIMSVHMGYSEVQKGYILYDLTNKVFFVNRDVIFNETTFPFSKGKQLEPVFKDTHSILGHSF